VQQALEEVVSASSFTRENWELFLKWPIDDPHLETIRQHCRYIVADNPRTKIAEYISKDGVEELKEVLKQFKREPNQLLDPTSPSVTPPAGAGGAPSVAADH
jgi:hypothetical protein